MNLLSLVPAEVRAAYDLMTQDFAPLDMETKLEPLLGQITAISVRARRVGRGATMRGG